MLDLRKDFTKLQKLLKDGLIAQDHLFMGYILLVESHTPAEIWSAMPSELKDDFQRWVSDLIPNSDQAEFTTNNYIVKPGALIRYFHDYLQGGNKGDTPLKDRAEWKLFGKADGGLNGNR